MAFYANFSHILWKSSEFQIWVVLMIGAKIMEATALLPDQNVNYVKLLILSLFWD